MHHCRYFPIFLILFLVLCLFPTHDRLFAQTDGYGSGDGIEGGVVKDDTQASLDGLIAWWKANSSIEMDDHEPRSGECKKVVGFLFDFGCSWDGGDSRLEGRSTGDDVKMFYCAVDKHHEKVMSDGNIQESDLYWSFQVTVFYGCDIPSAMTLTPDPGSIDPGEDSTVTIQIDCHEAGGVGGMTVNLWLEPGSPGTLDTHEVVTDGAGQATVTFTADDEGIATVHAQILACSQEENTNTVDADCQIDVNGFQLQVDLIYIGEVTEGIEFFSTFVHRMKIDLNPTDSMFVTGSGQGQTSFDFEYHNEQVHTENWSDSGFTECTAEGTLIDGVYTLNIDTTGNISYEHVVDVPGGQPIRIPIEAAIDWEQLLAEPVVIGVDPDSTFTASGSFPWGLTYTILARWVEPEE